MWYEITHATNYDTTETNIAWMKEKTEENIFIIMDYLNIQVCSMHELKD